MSLTCHHAPPDNGSTKADLVKHCLQRYLDGEAGVDKSLSADDPPIDRLDLIDQSLRDEFDPSSTRWRPGLKHLWYHLSHAPRLISSRTGTSSILSLETPSPSPSKKAMSSDSTLPRQRQLAADLKKVVKHIVKTES